MRARGDKIFRDPAGLLARLDHAPKPVVFTNGCFDILHRGHVAYLARAAELGETLLVAVNTDGSVQRQGKGGDRPLNPLEDRMAVLAALECVDLVTAFDEDTPLELIRLVCPQRLVKGGDWSEERIVGADLVRAAGGSVHSIPFEFERSTTTLIARIRDEAAASP